MFSVCPNGGGGEHLQEMLADVYGLGGTKGVPQSQFFRGGAPLVWGSDYFQISQYCILQARVSELAVSTRPVNGLHTVRRAGVLTPVADGG